MKRIHIGKIIHNYKNYGILAGHAGEEVNCPNRTKLKDSLLFWYQITDNMNFSEAQLVLYVIKDIEKYQVTVLNSVDAYPLVINTSDRKQRENGLFYCDEVWDLMKKGMSFIDGSFKSSYFFEYPKPYYGMPINYDHTIIDDIDAEILDAYYEIKDNEGNSSITLEGTIKTIEDIWKYVDSVDINKILSTYIVGSWGYYKRVPGKDNYFCYGYYKRIDTEDGYIRSLVPLEDKTDYFNTDVQGENEQDYSDSDEEEATRIRTVALAKYSKKEHKAFLLNEYFKAIEHNVILIHDKNSFIDSAFEITQRFLNFGENRYIVTIKEYNETKKNIC